MILQQPTNTSIISSTLYISRKITNLTNVFCLYIKFHLYNNFKIMLKIHIQHTIQNDSTQFYINQNKKQLSNINYKSINSQRCLFPKIQKLRQKQINNIWRMANWASPINSGMADFIIIKKFKESFDPSKVKNLNFLQNLKKFTLKNGEISNKDLQFIRPSMKNLNFLELQNIELEDGCMKELLKFQKLQQLNLYQNNITSSIILFQYKLSSLKKMNMSLSKIQKGYLSKLYLPHLDDMLKLLLTQ